MVKSKVKIDNLDLFDDLPNPLAVHGSFQVTPSAKGLSSAHES